MVNLLIVDDNEDILNSFEFHFRHKGWNVELANDGVVAIDLLRQKGTYFDAIILDRSMPNATGDQVIRWMYDKDLLAHICVVVLTAYPEIQSAIDALRMGVWQYLVKTIALSDLQRFLEPGIALKRVHRHRQALSEEKTVAAVLESIKRIVEDTLAPDFFHVLFLSSTLSSDLLVNGVPDSTRHLVKEIISGSPMLYASQKEQVAILQPALPESGTLMAIPVKNEDSLLGVIEMSSLSEGAFDPRWKDVLAYFAEILVTASIIQNRLEREERLIRDQVEKQIAHERKELEAERKAFATMRSIPQEVWNPRQIVECMRPDDWTGLYVIGTFDRRITLYAQQARALTLVRALFEVKDLEPGSELAVVGAGAAGLSAAVAAAIKGCHVTLYEQRDAVLPLQASASHRFLHPNIYDWPEPGSLAEDANLPILNWTADYADRVVSRLKAEFLQRNLPISFRAGSRITDIGHASAPWRVQLVGNEGLIQQKFQAVILAVGFGIDRGTGDGQSYWSGDPLNGPFEKTQRILISGAGDGGLVDLARASLRTDREDTTFRHDEAIKWFSESPEFETLGTQMREIDRSAQHVWFRSQVHVNLFQEKSHLSIPDSLIHRVHELKRSDTQVTFNYRTPDVFTLDSALVNRLLVLLLLRAGLVRPKLGRATLRESYIGASKSVIFDGPPVSTDEFDIVIMRHGPPKDAFAVSFPALEPKCTVLGGKLAKLGLTGKLTRDTRAWYS